MTEYDNEKFYSLEDDDNYDPNRTRIKIKNPHKYIDYDMISGDIREVDEDDLRWDNDDCR